MALDGIYLRFLKNEIEESLLNSRVDKIFQPSFSSVVIVFRGKKKLLLDFSPECAGIYLTENPPAPPQNPPMFCMLMRKHIGAGVLTSVRQAGLDRVLYFDFLTHNELGDKTTVTVVAELMGRSGNILLLGDNGKIIDALRKTTLTENRVILSGAMYIPPERDKSKVDITKKEIPLFSSLGEELKYDIMRKIEGVSPVSADLLAENKDSLYELQKRLKMEKGGSFYVEYQEGMAQYFGFLAAGIGEKKEFLSPSEALEEYLLARRLKKTAESLGADMITFVSSRIKREKRKLQNRLLDLEQCKNKERYRLFGELITANIYKINKGDGILVAENYYENPPAEIEIKLDKRKSPAENAAEYYRQYSKLSSAEKKLEELIKESQKETEYLESVLNSLNLVESEADVGAIREELVLGGYLKEKGKKKVKQTAEIRRYTTSEGFEVLVGKNNLENDRITFKIAEKNDIWLHIKNYHGAHVIIRSLGREITEKAIVEAAKIALECSKVRGKHLVDYTFRKYVKKPTLARPGRVIYTDYKTVAVETE